MRKLFDIGLELSFLGNYPEILHQHDIHCFRVELKKEQVQKEYTMSKPQHVVKKANHGKRPASSQARKAKRHQVKT